MTKEQPSITVRQLCFMAFMAALMCLLGPMAIPIGEVPISLATLVIYLSVYIMGMKMGTMSCVIYLLLGFVGLPVFSGYSGGVAKLAGPTGGYLVGYIFLALICGFFIEKTSYKMLWSGLGMIVGTAIFYVFGTVWFMLLMKCTLVYALGQCVVPFIIGDLLKIIAAVVVGREVRNRLKMAGLLI